MAGLPLHQVADKVSDEEFGEALLEEIRNTARRQLEDVDLSKIPMDAETIEVDVAVPFRIKVSTRPQAGRRKEDDICCICVDYGGRIKCAGSCG